MKMTYFVGPYDLLNHKTHTSTPMTIEGLSFLTGFIEQVCHLLLFQRLSYTSHLVRTLAA